MTRIEIIKQKLNELRELDKGYSIFGASRHQYQLNETLSENQLDQIEKDHQIVLSNEYKFLLKNLGNGGAGCGYGLEKLDLKNIDPPYMGTQKLLRNWDGKKPIDYDMVELDEISGYIKLFDFGCGTEYCLIVKGEERGSIIFFDCDGRFQKFKDLNLLDFYEGWLDSCLMLLKRVQSKLETLPLQEVIDTEWELSNYSVKEMILSLMGAASLGGSYSGNDLKVHLEKEYYKWKNEKQNPPCKWWQFWKTDN